jgi:hypothetical protein
MDERWAEVPGYEGLYEVSDQGRVRSLYRQTRAGIRGGGELKPGVGSDGYLLVVFSRDGKTKTQRVHQLVLRAFVGEPPPGAEVAHENGQQQDNRLVNLSYKTRRGNMLDSVRHGTHRNSRKISCPKCGGAYSINSRGQRFCPGCRSDHQRQRYQANPPTSEERRKQRNKNLERRREIERESKRRLRAKQKATS